jgi:hypothetical protein
MPVARCPRCDSPVTIDDADVGYDVECPTCRAVFAADEVLGPPVVRRSGRPRPEDDDEDEDRPRRRAHPEDVIAEARGAVLVPGILVAIVAFIGIGLAALDLAMIAMLGPQQFQQQLQQQMAALPGFGNAGPVLPAEVLIGVRVFVLLWESTILAGAVCMIRGKAYGFARTAMMMRLIPCAGMCCILGLPVGAWALVVLGRPDVRAGFALAAQGPRGDAGDGG